jgi:hypothetical protein
MREAVGSTEGLGRTAWIVPSSGCSSCITQPSKQTLLGDNFYQQWIDECIHLAKEVFVRALRMASVDKSTSDAVNGISTAGQRGWQDTILLQVLGEELG